MIDDPEEFAWQQLEAKQNKKAKPVTEREALRIAYNALIEIDKETPYPLAKHAAMVINGVLNVSATDWEAVAADQAMTIAMSRIDDDDIQEYKKPWVGLTDKDIDDFDIYSGDTLISLVHAIEAKLKELNNG
jgi:hypothetical protein